MKELLLCFVPAIAFIIGWKAADLLTYLINKYKRK